MIAHNTSPARDSFAASGRRSGLRDLERLLGAAASGRPAVAVVHGPAGIGKSSLVKYFLNGREDLSVFQASGAQWERDLDYGVLNQLLGPAARPAGQEHDAGAHDAQELDAGAGRSLLAFLRRQQLHRTTVVVVDNLHTVDAASLRALLFAARRLRTERVLFILVADDRRLAELPDGYRDLLYGQHATVIRLRPLTGSEVQDLARTAGVELSAPVAHQLAGYTGGNPRWILQLLEENPGGFGHGWTPSRTVPQLLAQEIRSRLSTLTARPRALVEAASVLGTESVLSHAAALAGLVVPPPGSPGFNTGPLQALDEACSAGLLAVSEESGALRLRFDGPLIQTAVYACISPSRRAQLHLSAAEIVEDERSRLYHRVAAVPLPNRELAEEVDAFAVRQAEAGAWSIAADALLRASQLHPTRVGRELRLLRALDAMIGAGDLPRAGMYAAEVATFAPSPFRDAVLGYLAIHQGRPAEAGRLLDKAWETCNPQTDPETAATISQRQVLHALGRWNARDLVAWCRRSILLAEPNSPAAIESRAILGLGLGALGQYAEAESEYEALASREDLGTQLQRLQLGRGWLHLAQDQPDRARDELAAAVPSAFRPGSIRISLWAQAWLAQAQFTTGDWDSALHTVEQAVRLQESVGMELLRPVLHWTAARIHSLRGEWDLAAAHRDRAHASADCYPIMQIPSCLAKASYAEARSDYDAVIRAFEPLLRLKRRNGMDEPGFWPWHDLYANALVMVERTEDASEFLAPMEQLAAERGHRSATARLAFVRGRILGSQGNLEGAKDFFEMGLSRIEGVNYPYLKARGRFAYGQTLRRAGKRREAAALLSAARELFAALGAGTSVERCDRELQASGLGQARREGLDFSTLTPQEQSVAALVAAGRTNKETALELFVSVKTVQYHLTRIYAKLGVSSRSELAARWGQGSPDPAP